MGFYRSITNIFKRPKPSWAAKCVLAYTDKSGMRYYTYADGLDMPVDREGEIEKCLMELRFGKDYSDVIAELNASLNNFDKSGRAVVDLTKIGYLASELSDREELLTTPDILFKICANALIREDESPYEVDQEVLIQKVQTFKSELRHGGLADFFQLGGLTRFVNLSITSQSDLIRFMNDLEMKDQQRQKQKHLIFGRQSLRGLLTEESTILTNWD